jgi:hypothetical protein
VRSEKIGKPTIREAVEDRPENSLPSTRRLRSQFSQSGQQCRRGIGEIRPNQAGGLICRQPRQTRAMKPDFAVGLRQEPAQRLGRRLRRRVFSHIQRNLIDKGRRRVEHAAQRGPQPSDRVKGIEKRANVVVTEFLKAAQAETAIGRRRDERSREIAEQRRRPASDKSLQLSRIRQRPLRQPQAA